MLNILGSKVLATNNREVIIEAYAKDKAEVITISTELKMNNGVIYDTSSGKLVGFLDNTFGGVKLTDKKQVEILRAEYILAGYDNEYCKWHYGEFSSLDKVHEYLEGVEVTKGVIFYKGKLAFTLEEGCLEQL